MKKDLRVVVLLTAKDERKTVMLVHDNSGLTEMCDYNGHSLEICKQDLMDRGWMLLPSQAFSNHKAMTDPSVAAYEKYFFVQKVARPKVIRFRCIVCGKNHILRVEDPCDRYYVSAARYCSNVHPTENVVQTGCYDLWFAPSGAILFSAEYKIGLDPFVWCYFWVWGDDNDGVGAMYRSRHRHDPTWANRIVW